MRIATWNVERVSMRSWKRLPAIQAAMATIDADIWVLTETREGLAPGIGFQALHCPGVHRTWKDEDERMVSIWSRWPIAATDLEHRARGAVSGIVDHPAGPLAVFGSVIPYANDEGPEGTATRWTQHLAEIERLTEEWPLLAAEAPLIIAGDLNQDRDGSGYYGSRAVRRALSEAFDAAGVVCLTEEDVVAAGKLDGHHLIDHIAVSPSLVSGPTEVWCWPPTSADGVRMSDHPGVAIDLAGR